MNKTRSLPWTQQAHSLVGRRNMEALQDYTRLIEQWWCSDSRK